VLAALGALRAYAAESSLDCSNCSPGRLRTSSASGIWKRGRCCTASSLRRSARALTQFALARCASSVFATRLLCLVRELSARPGHGMLTPCRSVPAAHSRQPSRCTNVFKNRNDKSQRRTRDVARPIALLAPILFAHASVFQCDRHFAGDRRAQNLHDANAGLGTFAFSRAGTCPCLVRFTFSLTPRR